MKGWALRNSGSSRNTLTCPKALCYFSWAARNSRNGWTRKSRGTSRCTPFPGRSKSSQPSIGSLPFFCTRRRTTLTRRGATRSRKICLARSRYFSNSCGKPTQGRFCSSFKSRTGSRNPSRRITNGCRT